MSLPRLTVALSSHRVETLPYAEQLMAEHDLVLLEEPADELFSRMLAGEIAIDAYVEEVAPAFPVFASASCAVWQRLHQRGIRFEQLDPFLEELLAIHDSFDQGGKPDDIPARTLRRSVYEAERHWTRALIAFYASAVGAPFDAVVDATLRFAQADAARGRLRDELRAQAVAAAARPAASVYVEAGYLHHVLWLELRRRWPRPSRARAVWLLEPVVRPHTGHRQVLSPGDRLTLAYTFRPSRTPRHARLLAARSLVYVKIAVKDELLPGPDPHPHTTDELAATKLVDALSYQQCQLLYAAIREAPQPEARARAQDYCATVGALVV